MSNKRKYIVSDGIISKEVFPINDNSLEYKWKRDNLGVKFIKELSTRLIFINKSGNNDFDFFHSYEQQRAKKCTEFSLTIYKNCSGVYKLEFEGILALNTGQWNLDQCTVSIDLKNNTTINDKITRFKGETDLPICSFTENGITGSNDNTFYLYDVIAGDVCYLSIDNLFAGGIMSYGQRINPLNTAFTNYPYGLFMELCNGIVRELLIKCGRPNFSKMLRSDFFDWDAVGDTPGYIGSVTGPIPSGSNYPVAHPYHEMYLPISPGINYVTGQPNKLTHLLFMPKSNANNATATEWELPISFSNHAPNSNKITFKDLEEIWATVFNAYWFIDSDGSMRVEHISWFNSHLNLYDSTSNENKAYNTAKNKYDRNRDEIPQKEVFKFSQNRDIINGGIIDPYANRNNEIVYQSFCVNKTNGLSENVYELPLVVTDIACLDSVNNNPDIYDNNGLMLIQASFGAIYDFHFNPILGYNVGKVDATCQSEPLLNNASPTTYENGHLQWANLIRRYLKDRRVLTIGLNGTDIVAFTSQTVKTKKQSNIIIRSCCNNDFIPEHALIRTELGDFEVLEAVYETKTGLIKMTILHD